MRLLRLCRSSMNIRFPTILFFRIQRCNSFPFQPRSHMGPLISSLGCFSKFPRIPILSYTPNMALFSFQRSTTLRGGRVTLTWNNLGIPFPVSLGFPQLREMKVQNREEPRASFLCAPQQFCAVAVFIPLIRQGRKSEAEGVKRPADVTWQRRWRNPD